MGKINSALGFGFEPNSPRVINCEYPRTITNFPSLELEYWQKVLEIAKEMNLPVRISDRAIDIRGRKVENSHALLLLDVVVDLSAFWNRVDEELGNPYRI